jgi:hypothetical protein
MRVGQFYRDGIEDETFKFEVTALAVAAPSSD